MEAAAGLLEYANNRDVNWGLSSAMHTYHAISGLLTHWPPYQRPAASGGIGGHISIVLVIPLLIILLVSSNIYRNPRSLRIL